MDKISIIVGSKSDLDILENARPYIDFFEFEVDIQVLSAHRQYDELSEYVKSAYKRDTKIIIACAGMAAHLPGVVASMTNLPVIGVPLDASPLRGVDALYSIVQMPRGIPVATMSIGKHGIINAIVYAARILSLHNDALNVKLAEFKKRGSKL